MSNFLAFAIVGALMVAAGVALYLGRVAPTAFYGGRQPRAKRDRASWVYATRAVGRSMALGGAAVVVASVVGGVVGITLDDEVPTLLVLGIIVVSIAFGMVQALAAILRG
ncbi:MAG: hypothetical protein H0U69_01245 [Trueperaceae bacterium]|nr:hypothetical protein [Trueperaceae bacterium]